MKKTTKKSDPLLGLTPEQFKMLHAACHRAFNTMAGDLACEGVTSMRRRDVIETVCDADYLDNLGCPAFGKRAEWSQFYRTVLEPWLRKNYGTEPFWKLMETVFPFRNYSLN